MSANGLSDKINKPKVQLKYSTTVILNQVFSPADTP